MALREKFDMTGRVAAVTGGARGIGRACADALQEFGCRIALLDILPDRLEQSAAEMGQGTLSLFCDVTDKAQVQAAFARIKEEMGRLDVLVNSAGICIWHEAEEMTEEEWDAVVDIHLKGAFLCSQAAARHMVEQQRGKIINVASVAGVVGTVGQVNYSAAKGGVIALTKSMARELARYNICVNVISLGIVATEMTEKIRTDEKLREIYMNRILLKRFAEAEDIAPAFVFFASDESNYITGQLLCVDGGYGMV
jgi:3-oxoacyl-[acyl-carrier protein] reductase